METDTSFYQKAPNVQPANLLEMAGNAVALGRQQQEYIKGQRALAGQAALGNALTEATDPATGKTDYAKANQLLQRDPNARAAMADLLATTQTQQTGQIQQQTAATGLAEARRVNANKVLGALLANRDKDGKLLTKPANVLTAYADAYRSGLIDENEAEVGINGLSGMLAKGGDADLESHLRDRLVQTMSPEQQAAAGFGTIRDYTTGRDIVTKSVSPMGTFVSPVQTQPLTVSPETALAYLQPTPQERARLQIELQKQIGYQEPGGTRYVTPQQLGIGLPPGGGPAANALLGVGAAAAQPPANLLTGADNAPQPSGNPLVPSAPAKAQPAARPQTSAATSAPVVGATESPDGKLGSFVPLGTEEVASAGAKDLTDLQRSAQVAPQNVMTLRKTLYHLQNTKTGAGADELQSIKSFLATQSPEIVQRALTASGLGPDLEKVSSFDEAKKLMMNYASAASGGHGTDARLAAALSSNASTKMTNLANEDIIKANIGLERYRQAMAKAARDQGVTPAQYNKWAEEWTADNNPAVYVSDMLDGKQFAAILGPMTKKQRDAFIAAHNKAVDDGYITQ